MQNGSWKRMIIIFYKQEWMWIPNTLLWDHYQSCTWVLLSMSGCGYMWPWYQLIVLYICLTGPPLLSLACISHHDADAFTLTISQLVPSPMAQSCCIIAGLPTFCLNWHPILISMMTDPVYQTHRKNLLFVCSHT